VCRTWTPAELAKHTNGRVNIHPAFVDGDSLAELVDDSLNDRSCVPIYNTGQDASLDMTRHGSDTTISGRPKSILRQACYKVGLLQGRKFYKASHLISLPSNKVQHSHFDFDPKKVAEHVAKKGTMPLTVLVSLNDRGCLPIKVGEQWYLV
jgi:hypothetical protein